MTASNKPVLVLGGGINGAAIARELLLNGLSVWLVDTADIASGTTAYSSRLIHGGLRYLEYGEFDLVRESLAERQRLLHLSPHLVKPLRLFIPVENRFGGFWQSVGRFLGLPSRSNQQKPRGLWLVRWGLWLYDTYTGTGGGHLPRRGVHRVGSDEALTVNSSLYHWLCSYTDAQIAHPERFVVSLLEDARALADEQSLEFRVLTYSRATLQQQTVEIRRVIDSGDVEPTTTLQPSLIVNATGAWVDQTLKSLHVESRQLIGGTKGSHFVTWHDGLRQCLDGRGIYAEAEDGRPVFLLPWGQATLVGTTDLPFNEPPETAVAEPQELEYLCDAVARVFPNLRLTRDDIEMHYCGVRPLPFVDQKTPAAITRRHFFEKNENCSIPLFSIIGGKLTTCRSLAEEVTSSVLTELKNQPIRNSQDRPLPGGESYPDDDEALLEAQNRLAERSGFLIEQVQAVWQLCGTQTDSLLIGGDEAGCESVAGTDLPVAFVRQVIRTEWVQSLTDLVERRLMLLYHRDLSKECLRHLTRLMVDEGVLPEKDSQNEIDRCTQRLQSHFGKRVEDG